MAVDEGVHVGGVVAGEFFEEWVALDEAAELVVLAAFFFLLVECAPPKFFNHGEFFVEVCFGFDPAVMKNTGVLCEDVVAGFCG